MLFYLLQIVWWNCPPEFTFLFIRSGQPRRSAVGSLDQQSKPHSCREFQHALFWAHFPWRFCLQILVANEREPSVAHFLLVLGKVPIRRSWMQYSERGVHFRSFCIMRHCPFKWPSILTDWSVCIHDMLVSMITREKGNTNAVRYWLDHRGKGKSRLELLTLQQWLWNLVLKVRGAEK